MFGPRGSKQFFFEKKNQKTFASGRPCAFRTKVGVEAQQEIKVFWFLF
jgi:hypothetical protein